MLEEQNSLILTRMMLCLMNNMLAKKILVIGDLHIGTNKNNPDFYKITLDYADWLMSILEENNIDTIVQLGDVFHYREMVHSPSIKCASEFFKKLKKYKIHIITGNHDCLYNDTSEVNTLKLLTEWDNITIHEKVTVEDKFCFCGWGTKLDDIPDGMKIIFGHFDIKSFHMSSTKISEHGFVASDLMKKCELLMSGHYHKPQIRLYDKKPLVYAGSTFQLNWGESGEDKYAYIIDTDTLEMKTLKNTVSPRFEYIHSQSDFDKVENNFVSVEIDKPEEFEKVVSKLKKMNAIDVRTTSKPIKKTADNAAVMDFKGVSVVDAIEEYCSSLLLEDNKKNLSIKKLKELYQKCI